MNIKKDRQNFIRFIKARGVTGRGYLDVMNLIYKNILSKTLEDSKGKDPINLLNDDQRATLTTLLKDLKDNIIRFNANGNEEIGAWSRYFSEACRRTLKK